MGDSNYQAAKTSRLGLKHGGGEIVEVEGGRIVRSTGRKDRHSKVCTTKGPRDRRVRLSAHTAIQFYDVQDRLGYDRPSKAFHNLAAESGTRRKTATIMGNEVQILQEIGNNPNPSSETPSSSLQFQDYPPDFPSRTSSHSQDLRLSLQSFPKPMLLLHHHQAAAAAAQAHQSEPVLFSGFNGSSAGWEHHNQQPAEIGKSQRLVAWNNGGTGGGSSGGSGGGRGPLQSSNTPLVRAWIEQPIPTNNQHHQIPQNTHHRHAALSGIGFTASGVFSGFRVPARFQGEEEEHDSLPNKLFSASSHHH
ncbi:hypothetical protein F3Y22_tig00110372pilonHSYRG00060 [Hibiscus syriacus]|uniref:TCP domain-containing protein n=1 Tax=Hibiscus syriacus TaxID=106335 RepID=A0A6A3AVI6_HIBSY|nr:hypothetical protein F3Y22_tig00110372pilonHSYRG00060 [Hibiscus syriacus]